MIHPDICEAIQLYAVIIMVSHFAKHKNIRIELCYNFKIVRVFTCDVSRHAVTGGFTRVKTTVVI